MPRDAGINGFLLTLIKRGDADVWFGLHDQKNEGQWKWIDGTALGTGYTAWAPGEPNNKRGVQDCAVYWAEKNFQWDDEKCDKQRGFICQFKPSGAEGN
ncbi:PREDICTED: C-type lectin 1-like [Branchiostoma belcheri]|uniref:C-type lectin 1-like n=1 Tax=Branchiostoma belcheri TaxID=7741 RepID=A0A6P4YF02_BRABE|nr:PREDICTED: C-type lectin 1-like [Branchiostoma belcheri]